MLRNTKEIIAAQYQLPSSMGIFDAVSNYFCHVVFFYIMPHFKTAGDRTIILEANIKLVFPKSQVLSFIN